MLLAGRGLHDADRLAIAITIEQCIIHLCPQDAHIGGEIGVVFELDRLVVAHGCISVQQVWQSAQRRTT